MHRYSTPGLDAHLASGNPDDDQPAIDSRIDAIYADDDLMHDIHNRVASMYGDDGELIATMADAYGVLKAITDGVPVDKLTPGQLDHLANLYRASSRICDLVRKEVEREACV